MKKSNIKICYQTVDHHKQRLRNKILHLLNKFKPNPLEAGQATRRKRKKRNSNKKSRERYKSRRYRDKMNIYINNEGTRNVYNLSTIDIPMQDLFALELGHGFVPAPNNSLYEEETLILEGFRFVDRIGKIDTHLSTQKVNYNNSTQSSSNIPKIQVTTDNSDDMFKRDESIPNKLTFSQLVEKDLKVNETKMIKQEFTNLNNKILNDIKSKHKRKFNLPKQARESIQRLKTLVNDKCIDIRKVDKGQMILIIDYEQRLRTEEINISKISSVCEKQTSNWEENVEFSEKIMKGLWRSKFINGNELTAVTGLFPGGRNGKLKNKDGSIKFTRVINNSELFTEQNTPYVYPLFKVHKLTIEELVGIAANEVSTRIPSRLVVGMGACQLSRVQIWLEHFLSPLAISYGKFEYIKDTNDFLMEIEKVKIDAVVENWDWDEFTLFSIDVKSLYPSVKLEYLATALHHCFNKCTEWTQSIKDLLIKLILYTLNNQQIYWNGKYYLLNQGIPTGGKHSVPLANIMLTYALTQGLLNNVEFQNIFSTFVKLWKRFIDDGCGIYKGTINDFLNWFTLLKSVFANYGLELTGDTDSHKIDSNNEITEKELKMITFLDVELFKSNGTIHTREHRKLSSSNFYLRSESAHPRHTFPGVVKSQLYRIRRLCSRNEDFDEAVWDLEMRCKNSGYSSKLIDSVLSQPYTVQRILSKPDTHSFKNTPGSLRLITLSGTTYENEFTEFAKRINPLVSQKGIKIEIVKSTAPTLGRILFNNSNSSNKSDNQCHNNNCSLCCSNIINKSGKVASTVTGIAYNVDKNLTCSNGGIYAITGQCRGQYSGKTIHYGTRGDEHFLRNSTTIYKHKQECNTCENTQDFSITFVENYTSRGKYSLSEREFLWNKRMKGVLNIQKTLQSN